MNACADQLVGPPAGSELQPASGGGPGQSAGSYGAPNASPNLGEPLILLGFLGVYSRVYWGFEGPDPPAQTHEPWNTSWDAHAISTPNALPNVGEPPGSFRVSGGYGLGFD